MEETSLKINKSQIAHKLNVVYASITQFSLFAYYHSKPCPTSNTLPSVVPSQ